MVTFLSGGTGTPKLLWGAASVFPPEDTTVVGNTGDDVVLGALHVSPDIDTVIFSQSGLLDRDRWWGIADDPTTTTDRIDELAAAVGIDPEPNYLPDERQTAGRRLSRWRRFAAAPEFMTIGDRDRAHHVIRTQLLETGATLSEATSRLAQAYNLDLEIFPMSDDPVSTIVHTVNGELHFQEYWVARRGEPAVTDVEYRGASNAAVPKAVSQALSEPVVIGPANPVTSLGPMLAIDAFADALEATPTVAVSPFVGDRVFSGPAAELMRGIDREPSTAGVAALLPHVDAFVLDEDDETDLDRPVVRTDTRIETRDDAARIARTCREALNEVM